MEGWENALSYFTLDIFIIRNFQICGKERLGCFLGKYLGNVLATEQAESGRVGVGEHTCLCCPELYFSFLCGTILKVMCAFPIAFPMAYFSSLISCEQSLRFFRRERCLPWAL